jgi:hypothetical protein
VIWLASPAKTASEAMSISTLQGFFGEHRNSERKFNEKERERGVMGERKIFESDGFVVTTERFVYGTKVIPLDDIKSSLPFVDKGWLGTIVIAAIGLALLVWGGIILKIIGLLLLPGAYFFFTKTMTRTLIIALNEGGGPTVNVSTTELLTKLVDAINTAIVDRKRASRDALRDELSSLPS